MKLEQLEQFVNAVNEKFPFYEKGSTKQFSLIRRCVLVILHANLGELTVKSIEGLMDVGYYNMYSATEKHPMHYKTNKEYREVYENVLLIFESLNASNHISIREILDRLNCFTLDTITEVVDLAKFYQKIILIKSTFGPSFRLDIHGLFKTEIWKFVLKKEVL